MPLKNIITGQHVSPTMREHAETMRRNMTPTEAKLWQCLKANRLEGYHFRRQQVIGRYIADFYCHAANLVVEVDGWVHQDQVEYDLERDSYLENRGLIVLRFTNSQVDYELDSVLALILKACQTVMANELPPV